MTRYIFSVWFKGEKPAYKPPFGVTSITERVRLNSDGIHLLTVEFETDITSPFVRDATQAVSAPTGESFVSGWVEAPVEDLPTAKPKKEQWWKKQRSPNLRREF